MIVIRTHASSTIGIGHLLRCRRLAVRLQSLGFEILFVVDHENEQLSGFLNTFSLHALYSSEIGFVSESEDAICFLKQMEGVAPQEVEAVLVDDYRLTAAGNFVSNSFSRDQFTGGLEFSLKEYVQIRGGYTYEDGMWEENTNAENININNGLSAGLTVQVPINREKGSYIGIDYAYRESHAFSGSHSFGIIFNF